MQPFPLYLAKEGYNFSVLVGFMDHLRSEKGYCTQKI